MRPPLSPQARGEGSHFRRRTSYISYTRSDLQDVLPVIEQFAKVESLDGHARSAKIRFEK